MALLGQLAFKALGWLVPWASPRVAKYLIVAVLGLGGVGYIWVKGYLYAKEHYETKLANLKAEQERRVEKARRARRAVRPVSSSRKLRDRYRRD